MIERCIYAIDPGMGGGIARISLEGHVGATKMPQTLRDLWDWRAECEPNSIFYIERVSGVMPTDGKASAAKFSRHLGHLDMLLVLDAPREVLPQKWMQFVIGSTIKDKGERKRRIKDRVQRRFPDVKVTLWNADALGLLWYALEKEGVLV